MAASSRTATLSAGGAVSQFNEKALEKLSQGKVKNGPLAELLALTQEEDTHLRRFNGKEADQISKLNYYGFRYYDPLSLTWTQADPLYRMAPDITYDEPRRMSLYAFSLNNPLRYLDPDGLEPTPANLRALESTFKKIGTKAPQNSAERNARRKHVTEFIRQSKVVWDDKTPSNITERFVLDLGPAGKGRSATRVGNVIEYSLLKLGLGSFIDNSLIPGHELRHDGGKSTDLEHLVEEADVLKGDIRRLTNAKNSRPFVNLHFSERTQWRSLFDRAIKEKRDLVDEFEFRASLAKIAEQAQQIERSLERLDHGK